MDSRNFNDADISAVVLPSQYWSATAARAAQPERRLMAAVLEEAISILARPLEELGEETRKAASEADLWLASDDRTGPFAFVSICDVLGLDPNSVRSAIARIHDGDDEFVRPRISAGRGRHRIRQDRPRSRSAA